MIVSPKNWVTIPMFTLFFAIPGVVSPLLLLLVSRNPKLAKTTQAQRVRSMTEEEREDLLEGLKAKWEQVPPIRGEDVSRERWGQMIPFLKLRVLPPENRPGPQKEMFTFQALSFQGRTVSFQG